jgi:intein/homing endonuclease
MSALQELQNYTFVSKYARWLEDKNRRETWKEAVERVKHMMHTKYADCGISDEINWAYDMMYKKKVLGSQRALQFGGDPILKRHAKIYNCTASYCDRLRFFQECFWLLLCGSGTGFSVQKHHVSKLPTLEHKPEEGKGRVYVVDDSIEGWANSLGVLLSSYFSKPVEEFKDWKNTHVIFDFSQIRAKGSSLASGVGKAPGYEPLANGLEKIRALLDRCINNGQKKLRPIDAYDIVMHSSDAVLSGGVRRSASLALFSPDDEEMAKAKTGNWYLENPQRARSNNSALLLKNETEFDEFKALMESVKEFGEPGFIWSESTEMIFNPCVTIDTKVLTSQGWIEFKDLLDKKSFEIEQDSRVFGHIDEFGEKWEVITNIENRNVRNLASNARKTGTNRDVYELELTCGRKIKATDNHHFATTSGMIELKNLTSEDEILIPLSTPYDSTKNSPDFKLGYLVGLVHGDGCFVDQNTSCRINLWGSKEDLSTEINKIEKYVEYFIGCLDPKLLTYNQNLSPKFSGLTGEIYGNKTKWTLQSSALNKYLNSIGIPSKKDNIDFVHKMSKEFKAGFISGMMYSDGHSEYNDNSKSLSVRLSSVNIKTLEDIQLILQELGVFARINMSREAGESILLDGQRNKKSYKTQKSYRLIIGGQQNCFNLLRFTELHPKDYIRVISIVSNKSVFRKTNKFSSYVKNITYIGKQDVYCLTENNRRTMIVNGMTSRRCVEIGMWPVDEESGKSGWQGCNLSTINCSSVTDEDDFYERCKAAAIIGTLQAGFTKLEYLGEISEKIFEREALLGVSLTGTMEKHDLVLSEKVLKAGAKVTVDTNKEISKKIDINQAARVTCLKPEGTSSSMLGTSSGIHPHHAKRYIRHVQANVLEAPYQHFKKLNPQACEKSSWSANNTDEVVKFPIEVPDGAKLRNQLPAVEMLKVVKETQKNWVSSGKNRALCTQDYLSHNVSNTVTVKPDEWEDVTKFIYENRKYFAGISLIPQSGDKDYPQAPFTTVYTSREIVKEYGDAALWCSGLIELGLNAFDNNLWAACDYATMNQAKETDTQDKLLFMTKMKNFAGKYFNSDLRRLTYCMKDVYNWKIYCDLFNSFKKVDYTQLSETEDNTVGIEEISCAGGACLI